MKEINAINTKKQRYVGQNTRTHMQRTALQKARVNWKYCFIALRLLHCTRLKYSVQKKSQILFVQDTEFGVAEINAPLN